MKRLGIVFGLLLWPTTLPAPPTYGPYPQPGGAGGSATTFNTNQFSSSALGTNILDGAWLTNAQIYVDGFSSNRWLILNKDVLPTSYYYLGYDLDANTLIFGRPPIADGSLITNLSAEAISGNLTIDTLTATTLNVDAINGNGAGLSNTVNNSLYGFDSEAVLYCNARGISNLWDMFKIDGFVRTLKLGGVWGVMSDAWLLRSNLNSINLTNAISWNGKQHVVYGATAPLYDETGLTFVHNASGALWLTNLADMRTNTTVVQAQIDAATWDQTNPLLVLQNGGLSGSFGGSYLGLGVLNSGNSGVQWRQGNGSTFPFATYEDHHRLLGLGVAGSYPSDFPRIFATAVSNTTWRGWYEHIPAGPNTLTPVFSQASVTMASSGPMTNMIVGARVTGSSPAFNSFGGKVQTIALFSRVLTQAEIETVNRAFRCLDPQTENWVFYGDSRLASYSWSFDNAVGDQRNAFVNRLMNQTGNSSVRFYNHSVPGIDLDQQTASSNFLRSVSFYAPDGRYVKRTRALVLASGYNTFSDGKTVLQAVSLASNLCSQIRKLGMEVNLFTEAPIATANYATNSAGTGWTNWATEFNTMLITNTGMYDRLLRYDLAFTNYERTTNSGFYTDGVHPSAAGNRKWADFTTRQMAGDIDSLTFTLDASGNVVAAGFAAFTNGYYMPSNSLSIWPATPRSPGAAYWGNSNGTIYLLQSGLGNTWIATNKIGL